MSTHLSSEQISRWMAGDRNPDAEQHLRECAQCAAEIERISTVLSEFRSSAIAWSASRKGAEIPGRWMPRAHRRRFSRGGLRWKLAAATLTVVLAGSIWKNFSDRHREEEALEADARLWEEVNTHISRPVPAPMEPLMKLMVWEPDTVEK
jgi:hypothetical protein